MTFKISRQYSVRLLIDSTQPSDMAQSCFATFDRATDGELPHLGRHSLHMFLYARTAKSYTCTRLPALRSERHSFGVWKSGLAGVSDVGRTERSSSGFDFDDLTTGMVYDLDDVWKGV
jgi:hypothetical protein